tara:strand:- start:62 stop:613 length:552 start_codon:yes stop_codon:yes gene_type:complete
MIKVIDNFANIQEQLELIDWIKRECAGHTFHLTSLYTKNFPTKNTIDYPQFVNVIFGKNKIDRPFLFPHVYSLLHLNKLSNKFIDRIKINTTFPYPKNNKDMYGPIHTDSTSKKSISIIYYVNNSDGDTLFFDEELNIIKRVSPRQGRAVVFHSNIKHAASCPINSKYRQVINFVLFDKMEKK